jgi:pimeloyl-ACP methyl ester carboxylesterase
VVSIVDGVSEIRVGRTVMFETGPGGESCNLGDSGEPSEPGKLLLVVSPPLGGDEGSPNVRALVSAGLSAGWSVAVHSRDKGALFDPVALRECVEAARALAGRGARTGVVGLSVGAHEACKARLPYPVVSVSNGYDFGEAMRRMHPLARARVARRVGKKALGSASPEDLSCVRELLDARAPTLLVNSRNDPLVPDSCLEIGDAIASEGGRVACVTTHRGGHLGFVGRDGKRWAFEVALGFLESAVTEV